MKAYFFILLLWTTDARASDIETLINNFYREKQALEIRGTVEQKDIAHCLEALTPSFCAAIASAQDTVDAWTEAALRNPEKYRELKPPPDEGPLFTNLLEGGNFVEVVVVITATDRAYATVRFSGKPPLADRFWTDILVLHRIEDEWKIDDILTNIEFGVRSSIRKSLQYEGPR